MAHVTREFLRKVLAGTAGHTETAQIATHLFSCPACRSVAYLDGLSNWHGVGFPLTPNRGSGD